MTISPTKIAKLQAANDYAGEQLRLGTAAGDIIAGLVRDHGARFEDRQDPYRLRCAGVAASCTWSKSDGLLGNWQKTATSRLMKSAMEGSF